MRRRWAFLGKWVELLVAIAALFGGGCSGARSTEFAVAPGAYRATFDATREVLRGYHFNLDRVDSQMGVITTQPKDTAGLATLWDREQSTVGQEFEDLLNQQRRVVRVVFEDAGHAGDMLDPAAALRGRVEVTVYRVQSPGVRTPSKGVGLTTVSSDPLAKEQGTSGAYEVAVSQDSRLAERLAAAIVEHVAKP